ncbi:hypothetical protein Daesc_005198 [Daldinia eschscholtzii]|uniref:Uncharacterized protein n=1 Tax=Daldinia eschscholtzii TaxID=292717 RepID=A0AAX6ML36_9PEZI
MDGFFFNKAGLCWNNRVSKTGTTGPTKLQYKPPTGRKPVGVICPQDTVNRSDSSQSPSKDSSGPDLKAATSAVAAAAGRKHKKSPISGQSGGSGRRPHPEEEKQEE